MLISKSARALFLSFLIIFSASGHTATKPKPFAFNTISIDPVVELSAHWPDFNNTISTMAYGILNTTRVPESIRGAKNNEDALRILVEGQEINLREMILRDVRDELGSRNGLFQLVEQNGDATLSLDIDDYGIGAVSNVTNVRPIFGVATRLINQTGTLIWTNNQNLDERSKDNSVQPTPWITYITETPLLKADFEKLSKFTAKAIADELESDYSAGKVYERRERRR